MGEKDLPHRGENDLREKISTELSNRGKALRLCEEGAAENLHDAWRLLVRLGEVAEDDVPDRYRSDPQ